MGDPDSPLPPSPPEGAADPFETDHLLPDLRGRSVRGGAFTLAVQGGRFLLQLTAMVVLARWLAPADFGRIAMVTAVTGFFALFKDLGLSMAVVQRPRVTHEQVSALFWINTGVSTVFMLLVYGGAPWIAAAFGDPALAPIARVLAVTLLVSGLGVQHYALLQRQMRFRAIALLSVASLAVGVFAALITAASGGGHWALVVLVGAPVLCSTVLAWWVQDWRPGRPARAAGVRSMLGFGGYLAAFQVVNYFARTSDDVLLGGVLGARPLGLYNRAYRLITLPIGQLNAPVSSIVAPSLSRLAAEPDRFRSYLLRALGVLAGLGVPVAVFCIAAAEDLVLLAFGPQWHEVVPLFRALGGVALVGTTNVVVEWVCVPLGLTRRQFAWSLIAVPIIVASFVIGLQYGALGVAVAASVAYPGCWVASCLYCFRGTPLRFRHVLGVLWRPFGAAAAAGAAVWGAIPPLQTAGLGLLPRFLASVVLFGAVHLLLVRLLPGGRAAWEHGLDLLRTLGKRRG